MGSLKRGNKMNKAYRNYLIDNWKEAEELSKEVGCTDNKVVISFFERITQPYYYWLKGDKK